MTSGENGLILLIEDEPQMRRFLRATLQSHDFRLIETETGEEGLRQAAAFNPDVVLLDLGLPDQDGLDVIEKLREWASVPVIILSARGQDQDKIRALDAGADDYLTKPFSAGELMARIRVALRHRLGSGPSQSEPVYTFKNLKVDLSKRVVSLNNREIHLTPIEYRLLSILVRHAGKVLTHQQLLKEVWGPKSVDQLSYLRVYMTQLRHKLEENPARPRYLVNEPGVGYRLKCDPEEV
jgi:two-component system KDP operon response regulator KdpE